MRSDGRAPKRKNVVHILDTTGTAAVNSFRALGRRISLPGAELHSTYLLRWRSGLHRGKRQDRRPLKTFLPSQIFPHRQRSLPHEHCRSLPSPNLCTALPQSVHTKLSSAFSHASISFVASFFITSNE